MSKSHGALHNNARAYKAPLSPPPDHRPAPQASTPRRKGIYIASGLLLYALTTYTTYLYTTLTLHPPDSLSPSTDVSSRYDTTAAHFDADVSFTERVTGINRLRKRLVAQARGDVLEVCVGTGRNGVYYDLGKVRSVTFLDQSPAMVNIARGKWRAMYPTFGRVRWYTQNVMEPLPCCENEESKDVPSANFTTILQTMGVCSTPAPSTALARLGTLAHPTEGRILLLEHGRSYYTWINWILDKSAARHADRHGCWWNRDVGAIVEASGLRVEKMERKQFGTLWYIEARPPVGSGEGGEGGKEGSLEREKTGWLGWWKG